MTADSGLAPNATREAASSFDLVAELTHAFAASRCVTKTLDLAVQRISMALQAEGGAVFLLDEPPTTLTCVACCGPVSLTGTTLPVGEGIIGRSIRSGRGEVIGNVSLDRDFFPGVDDATGFRTLSLLCSPIMIHGQCLGAIELVNPLGARSHFAPEDLQVLEVLAAATGLALLGARSTERLVQQERMSKELDLAALIQKSMLPQPRGRELPGPRREHPGAGGLWRLLRHRRSGRRPHRLQHRRRGRQGVPVGAADGEIRESLPLPSPVDAAARRTPVLDQPLALRVQRLRS